MSESKLWDHMRQGIGALWDAERIENKLNLGVPDVAYSTTVTGWIELKYLDKLPAKASTPLRIKHYTAEQRNFLFRHGRRAGTSWLFLEIYSEGRSMYLLYDWRGAQMLGKVPTEEALDMAVKRWHGHISWVDFIHLISRPRPYRI